MNARIASVGKVRKSQGFWFFGLGLALVFWFALYGQLLPLAKALVAMLPIEEGSHLASSVEFFSTIHPRC